MFIFNLTYIKPITEVEKFLPQHITYLDRHYTDKQFICSGRKVPRTGGIILCNCATKEEATEIIAQDPFYKEQIAKYDIIEFVPTKLVDTFQTIIEEAK